MLFKLLLTCCCWVARLALSILKSKQHPKQRRNDKQFQNSEFILKKGCIKKKPLFFQLLQSSRLKFFTVVSIYNHLSNDKNATL